MLQRRGRLIRMGLGRVCFFVFVLLSGADATLARKPDCRGFETTMMVKGDKKAVEDLLKNYWGVPLSPDVLEELFSQDTSRTFAYVTRTTDGKLVGYMLMTAEKDGRVRIRNWAVHPHFRRRGIATAMIRRGLTHANFFDWKIATAVISQNDKSSMGFFDSVGFVPGDQTGAQLEVTFERPPEDDSFRYASSSRRTLRDNENPPEEDYDDKQFDMEAYEPGRDGGNGADADDHMHAFKDRLVSAAGGLPPKPKNPIGLDDGLRVGPPTVIQTIVGGGFRRYVLEYIGDDQFRFKLDNNPWRYCEKKTIPPEIVHLVGKPWLEKVYYDEKLKRH